MLNELDKVIARFGATIVALEHRVLQLQEEVAALQGQQAAPAAPTPAPAPAPSNAAG